MEPSLPVKCPKCPKSFKNEHGLKVHDYKVHAVVAKKPAVIQVPKQQPQQSQAVVRYCPHCGLPIEMIERAINIARGLYDASR